MVRIEESLLTGLPPFSRLASREIREILDRATHRRWDAGSSVFLEAEPADRFFLLLDGTIRVVRTMPDGEQVVPHHIPAGQLFGIARALRRDTYPATAVAAVECFTLSWPTGMWDDFAARYDGFATETWREIGERMEMLHEQIAELSTRAVEQRVAAALLRMVGQSGRKTQKGIEIGFPITRGTISDMTGTTLHTVSRLLSSWEKLGYVASARKRITITDPHRLVLIREGRG